jgi:hypothetical protein
MYIEESVNTKFLGLKIDNHLTWKNHIDLFILKLSRACYAVGSMSRISSSDTLKSIYVGYFHSIMKYGIIFGGNSPCSKTILTLQKRTIRIIAGVKSRNSCRNIFMRLEILPLPCECMFTLMNFVVNNQEHFQTQQCTVLTLGIGTTFINQLPIFHVFKNVHTVLASKSSRVYN